MHPILLRIGSFDIYSWGIMAALGVLAGVMLVGRLAGRRGMAPEQAMEAVAVSALAALLLARLTFIVERLPFYLQNPQDVLDLRAPGMSSLGGLVGLLLAGGIYARRQGLDPRQLLDVVAPGLLLMVACGRVGCFLNGCCQGRPCGWPWAVCDASGAPRHPCQLYEAFLVLLLCVLVSRSTRLGRRPGGQAAMAVLGYSALRFGVEFFREGPMLGHLLTPAQVACVLIAAFAGGWQICRPRPAPKRDAGL